MSNTQYSVIHEIGDFGYPENLTSADNALLNEQYYNKVSKDEEKRIKQREKQALNY